VTQSYLLIFNNILEIVPINTENIKLQTLNLGKDLGVQFDILRLDLIHPIISGNKWFKLRYYLEDAKQNNCTEIASFGGAYSNHIVAMACACFENKLQCVGFIRGDQTEDLSPTLQTAKEYGMELQFVNRTDYKNKTALIASNQKIKGIGFPKVAMEYWVPKAQLPS